MMFAHSSVEIYTMRKISLWRLRALIFELFLSRDFLYEVAQLRVVL